jgi:NAD(P)H-dependent FMN reductase
MSSDGNRPLHVLIFGASLRHGSLNDRLAQLAQEVVVGRGAHVDRGTMAEFDCPSYDGDMESEGTMPEPAKEFCRRLKAADAFMVASPEYNASMPGVLKNLIDWTSRMRPQPFNGKQCFLLSASPSMVGGNRGLWSLRIPLEHLGARVYPDMFSLAQAHEAFGSTGRLGNDLLQKRFDETVGCFLDLVEAAMRYPGLKKQWVEFLGEKPNAATDRTEVTETEAA